MTQASVALLLDPYDDETAEMWKTRFRIPRVLRREPRPALGPARAVRGLAVAAGALSSAR